MPLSSQMSLRCQLSVVAVGCSVAISLHSAGVTAQAQGPAREQAQFFERQVKPILRENCFKCHGDRKNPKGGLRLTSRSGLIQGGETGPAVSLGEPQKSLLLAAINYKGYGMPPSGKLPREQIEILTKWVKMGLPWPSETVTESATVEPAPEPPQVTAETRQHWSFQRVNRPKPVPVSAAEWVRNPIDAFVLARLEAAGLRPAKPAPRTELLRRAYYDLTGLPPDPEDVKAFLADKSAKAFERVVDRLLESPHYGERWARHWLDLVRYAESNSYERDGTKPFVWRYRDYVIRAFNDDKPYDQFVREQLAGDEMAPGTRDAIIATGYYRLGTWQDEPVDPIQELYEDLDDIVRTTGEVFLGITIGCARCHDHKLDPIPQRDYYRFLAFFRNIRRFGVRAHKTVLAASMRTIGSAEQHQRYNTAVKQHQAQLADNRKQLGQLERKLRRDLVSVERDEWKTESARIEIAKKRIGKLISQREFDHFVALNKRRDDLRRFKPPGLDQALCVKEHGRDCPPTRVLVRGNAHVPGAEVVPGFLSVLTDEDPQIDLPPEGVASTGRRTALASWLVDQAHPLTARVMANRIWQFHFGRGIVRSPNDFGLQGAAPTHPRLLDWLAAELVDGGWRMKRLHRLIMLSNTYQMSSRPDDAALAIDPGNDLFWRFDMRRLSAEEIRDSILAANGSLNRKKMFGPSIYPNIPAEVLAGQSRPGADWGTSSPQDVVRRSIYIHVKRSLVVPMIANFDGADTDASCPVRFTTTQPTQALGMLNSTFINQQGRIFAEYLLAVAGVDPAAQVELALWRVLQRPPIATEIERGRALLAGLRERFELTAEDALTHFCLTALNLNEFMYLD